MGLDIDTTDKILAIAGDDDVDDLYSDFYGCMVDEITPQQVLDALLALRDKEYMIKFRNGSTITFKSYSPEHTEFQGSRYGTFHHED